jgi:uncharacterized protein YcnI
VARAPGADGAVQLVRHSAIDGNSGRHAHDYGCVTHLASHPPHHHLVAAVVCGAALSLGASAVALAHVDAEPGVVQAGAPTTVGFGVQHGCDGSPTVELRFRAPAQASEVSPVDKDGWTTSTDDDVITFAGGPLGPDSTDIFEIEFTAPDTPGTIYFPVVQRCSDGEIFWIDVPADGAGEPASPAPAVVVIAGPPTAEELAGIATEGDAERGGHHGASVEAEVEATAVVGGGVANGPLIAAGLAATAVVAGTAFAVRRRRDTTG